MQPFYDRRRLFSGIIDIIKKVYTVPFIKKIFPKLTTFKYTDGNENEINVIVNSGENIYVNKLQSTFKNSVVDGSKIVDSYINVYYDYVIDDDGRPVPKDIGEFNFDMNNGVYYNSILYDEIQNVASNFQYGKTYYLGDIVLYNRLYYVCTVNKTETFILSEWKLTDLPYFKFSYHSTSGNVHKSVYDDRVANYTEDVDVNYKLHKKVNIEFKNIKQLDGYTDPPYMRYAETFDEESGYSGVATLICPDGYEYKNPVYYSPFFGYNSVKSIKFSSNVQYIDIEKVFYGLFRYNQQYNIKPVLPLGLDENCNISGVTVNGVDNCDNIIVDSSSINFYSLYNMLFTKPKECYNNPEYIGKKIVYAIPKYRNYIINNLFVNDYNNKLFFVNEIGRSAFAYYNLGVINKLIIPSNINSIEWCAFAGCNIKSLYLNSDFVYNNELYTVDITDYCKSYLYDGGLYEYSLGLLLQYQASHIVRNSTVYVRFLNDYNDVVSVYSGTWNSMLHKIVGNDFYLNSINYGSLYSNEILPLSYKIYLSFYVNYDDESYGLNQFAFLGCPIEKLVVDADVNMQWGNVNDVRWLIKDTLQTLYIGTDEDNESYTLNYKDSMKAYQYANCVNLYYVNINKYLSSIASYAFLNCVNLYYIVFNGGLDNDSSMVINRNAFVNCVKMRTVDRSDKRIFQLPYRNGSFVSLGVVFYYELVLAPSAFKSCGIFDVLSLGIGRVRYWGADYRFQKIFDDTYAKEINIDGHYTNYFNVEEDICKSLETLKVNVDENSTCEFINDYEFRVYNDIHTGESGLNRYGYVDRDLHNNPGYNINYPLYGYYNLKNLYFYGNISTIGTYSFFACPIKKIVIDADVDFLSISNYAMDYDRYDSDDTSVCPSLTDSVINDFYLYTEIDRTLPVWVSFRADRTYYVSTSWGYQQYTGDTFSRSTQYYYWDGVNYMREGNPSNDMDIYIYDTATEDYVLYTGSRIPRPTSGTDYYYYIPNSTVSIHSFLNGRRIENLYVKSSLKRNLWLEAISTNVYYVDDEHYPDNPHYQT